MNREVLNNENFGFKKFSLNFKEIYMSRGDLNE